MRILHLITRLIVGGAMENTILSCEGAAAAGHEVILASGPTYGPEGSMLERVKNGNYDYVELPNLHRDISPIKDYVAYKEIRLLLRDRLPDVLHTHASKAGLLGRRAAMKEKTPIVVHTIHGLAFHPYQSALKNWIYITAEKKAARWTHQLVTVCDAMRDQALAKGIGKPELYQTVYSGMDVNRFAHCESTREEMRKQLGIAEDDFVIGTVARLFELKGHDDMLDALGDAMKANPNLKLLWVGDGLWRERLEQRIEELGLKDQVILTGLVPPSQVPMMMRAMDTLAHPSYREGLARALPQALLSKVPVVSYDCDGAPEICIEGETGKLVPTGNRELLRDACLWMFEHPQERQQMAEHGQQLCLERFSAQTMCNDLHGVYERLQG